MDNLKKIIKSFLKILHVFGIHFSKHRHLIFKYGIYLIFFYQIIQLILEYTKFNIINQYRTKSHLEYTSFTFCIAKENIFKIEQELTFHFASSNLWPSMKIERSYFQARHCFYYRVEDNYKKHNYTEPLNGIITSIVLLLINYPISIYLFAHNSRTPSHFSKLLVLKPKQQRLSAFDISQDYSLRKLLPSPFSHDCYDYENEASKFQSREYCYLDVMKKMELKYCTVNKYWTFNEELKQNITQCFKPNFSILNKLCKIDCFDITKYYSINKNEFKHELFLPENSYLVLIRNVDIYKQRLYLEYSPKFTKIELFSTIGGLFGMWLGYSIKDIIYIVFEKIYHFVIKLSFYFSFLKKMKIGFFSTLLIFILMSLNLKQLISEYLSGQKITQISVVNEVDLPDFWIIEQFDPINPECRIIFEHLISNFSNIEKLVNKNYRQFKDINKKGLFFKEIIYEYGYEYFYKKFSQQPGLTRCIIIDKNNNRTDCKNNIVLLHKQTFNQFIKIYYFPKSWLQNKIQVNNIKKIILEFNAEKCFSKILSILENGLRKFDFSKYETEEINIKFQKLFVRNALLNDQCISIQENNSYDQINCWNKYFHNLLHDKYKFDCMPRDRPLFNLDELKNFGKRFCDRDKLYNNYITEDDKKALKSSCPIPCEYEFVTVNHDQKPHPDKIKFNFIPKSNFKSLFKYSLSMDLNKFIYDIGGTIGMWIGYSALTVPLYIQEIVRKLSFQTIRKNIVKIYKFIYNKLFSEKLISFMNILLKKFKTVINIINIRIVKLFHNIFRYFRSVFQNRVNP